MKKRLSYAAIFILALSLTLSGCSAHGLSKKDPVTITLWHNYAGQMDSAMDLMIDEFNDTVGLEKGIIVDVTSISSSSALHNQLITAANGDPGAPELPDITTCYPKTAVTLQDKDLLVDLNDYFSKSELADYIPRFLQEGEFDDGLYVFPTAKSTEVMFVNQTIFNRFAAETGAKLTDLSTFEGLFATAEKYYQWTDARTPDIANDGKAFFYFDSLFNLAQIGCAQLGSTFVSEAGLDYTTDAYKKVWNFYFEATTRGYAALYDKYGTDLFKTGDIVCSVGSTAGTSFFPAYVTYPDNTTEETDLGILPYPVFEGGQNIAMQRGGGMCITKSDERTQYAASLFLKWFTALENNLNFVATTGYLPVTEEAFGKRMNEQIETTADPVIKKLLTAAVAMHAGYDFYIPPVFESFDSLEKNYNTDLRKAASDAKAAYFALLSGTNAQTAYAQIAAPAFDGFVK